MQSMDLSRLLSKNSPLSDPKAAFSIGYGLYVATTREDGKDSGLVINTFSQIGSKPDLFAVGIQKANFSKDVILRTGKINVNVLDMTTPFSLISRFGFQSGRTTDKMKGLVYGRSENNLPIILSHTNAYFSLSVKGYVETASHVLFLCTAEESAVLSNEKSLTYAYYHEALKPKKKIEKSGFVCKICGYVHESDTLPDNFLCPICKHPATDFERITR